MSTITINFEEAILKGITTNQGNPKDMDLLTEADFIAMGKLVADRGAKRRMKFHSWVVTPINNVDEGYKTGHYNEKYDHITTETIPVKQLEGQKRVYLVPFNETIGENDYVVRLAEHGLKPCVDCPNYLLGLMKQVPESEMPEELGNKYFVAAEPDNPSSVFFGKHGDRCFLGVRRDGSNRDLVVVGAENEWDDCWAFLAEEA